MKLQRFAVEAYRMHTPKWAFDPKSGAGAAQHGGRVNRRDYRRSIFHWNRTLRFWSTSRMTRSSRQGRW